VDALARSHRDSGLPHAVLVDLARDAIATHGADAPAQMSDLADGFMRDLLQPVVNATGVLLHTNLGRAPVGVTQPERAMTVEFDLRTGQRGSRQDTAGPLLARLCGAEAAIVVNNNAAAVLLVLAALAEGRDVPVARGESVEIGGAFRVPEVMEQSGARLIDVGTTNRTRLSDYAKAIARKDSDVAMVLKVHPSNYRVEGFVEETDVSELATLGVPVVADIGSGLLNADTPWLGHGPPAWLAGEPAAKQTLAAGADLVTFSGDKLLGGPQAGIIAGRADLVKACASHPLARALRPGGLVLGALQQTALAYLRRDLTGLAFWRMADTSVSELRTRATAICAAVTDHESGPLSVVDCEALVGAGSAPGVSIASVAVAVPGDHLAQLRAHQPPVIARVREGKTMIDVRSVDPADDPILINALRTLC
jgi:L-seryl-tRNA(Ser) seleniumtransferase